MTLFVNIEKKLGDFNLKVNFETANTVMALLGPSGCGKSMTLKCIAGIEKPDKGKIVLDGVTLFDSEKKINLPPQKRRVGYLFQEYALFPNMTVEENIGCGLRDKKKKDETIKTLIETMNLKGLENFKPDQLSGGQKQRVALARIIASEPEVLLLDEPFSALDTYLRFQLEREVKNMVDSFQKPVIFVSHDPDEVYRLSNKVGILVDGNLENVDYKENIYVNPKTRNGAFLVGCKNVSRAEIQNEGFVYAKDWNMALKVENPITEFSYVGIFGDSLKIADENHRDFENIALCKVVDEIENPSTYTIMIQLSKEPGDSLIALEIDKEKWRSSRKDEVLIEFPQDKILLLKE